MKWNSWSERERCVREIHPLTLMVIIIFGVCVCCVFFFHCTRMSVCLVDTSPERVEREKKRTATAVTLVTIMQGDAHRNTDRTHCSMVGY